ncbi:MAG TPA: sensor histidine kinase [Ktedonobacteraceae bacterium]|nr:sensor histidine kinase [Ktedonobacteraceae bacterium]
MPNILLSHPTSSKIRARWRLSLFEKAILINTLLLIGEALAGLWITSHSLETHHYLIDTSFIVAATLLSVLINVLLLRASFRPLFSLLRTIRAVGAGGLNLRASDVPIHSEVGELALAFNTMLDQIESSRRQQAMLILQAQEEERRRVARELHDESSQNLTALLVHSEILSQTIQAIPDRAVTQDMRVRLDTELRQLTQLTQHTLESVRALALQLRPGILDDLGLNAALRWLAGDFRQRLHLPVELSIDGLEESLQASPYTALYATTLFRIAQECLTNAARYAQAQHVFISFQQGNQHISFFVRDDGNGFDPASQTPGLGILGMRERAALLGGTLTITSSHGKGTAIEARLPLLPNAPGVNEEPAYVVHA